MPIQSMTPEAWTRLRGLIEEALLVPLEHREAFLAGNAGDPAMFEVARGIVALESEATAMFSIDGWMASPRAMPSEQNLEGVEVGAYRLLKELGRGGMGAVYLAERADGLYEQVVAIKLLQENLHTPTLVRRFTQERQILARLQHSGIARLLDGGVLPDGRPYLVMEHVNGLPIDVYCDRANLGLRDRLRLVLLVAEAVQSAHQQLVLHLDLKPANILVTAEGEPRLLDFGIARYLADSPSAQTDATLRLLTPRYASPEQAKGEPLGVASDVFSLGTLLYKLLTGRLPYPLEDATPLEAARLLAEAAPTPPSQAASPADRAALVGDLDTILLQALRKEPERRYPTVAAFALDIQRYLASEPVAAHPDSVAYRAGKFFRRNRIAVLAVSIATMILIGSAIGIIHSTLIARRDRDLAQRRFKDVQTLAHGYIFDLDPKLETIPGTVNVRAFVLQNAIKYLDAMSAEQGSDDALVRELGKGYLRVGELQAHEGVPSLSDRAGAMHSLEKSYALQESLLRRNPGDLAQRGQVVAVLRVLADNQRDVGDLQRSEQYAKLAWDTGQPILSAGPRAKNFHTMINVALTLAQNRGAIEEGATLGDPAGALPWLDRVHELSLQYGSLPAADLPNPELPVMDLRHELTLRASVARQLGRDEEARADYEEALKLAAKIEHGSMIARISNMVVHYTYATFLLEVHDPTHAAEVAPPVQPPTAMEAAGADRQQLLQIADLLALHARIDIQLHHEREAMRELNASQQLFERLHLGDPKDRSGNSQMASSFFDMGQEPSFDVAVRRHLLERGLAVIAPALAEAPESYDARLQAAQGHLALAETCTGSSACPLKAEQLNLAEHDLDVVLATHPGALKASQMRARVEQLRRSRESKAP